MILYPFLFYYYFLHNLSGDMLDTRTKRLQAISAMDGSTWEDLIYSACVVPIALYVCSAWLAPKPPSENLGKPGDRT